jgi:hypothetical protein
MGNIFHGDLRGRPFGDESSTRFWEAVMLHVFSMTYLPSKILALLHHAFGSCVTAASQLHKAISMVMAHTRTDVLVF